MSDAFTLAVKPIQHRCLGLALEPLTLGHLFLLESEGVSPLTGGTFSISDLALCCFICSQPWNQSKRDLKSWWSKLWGRWWGWRCRKSNWLNEFKAFENYISDSLAGVIVKFSGGQSEPLSSPWPIRMLAACMCELGMSEADALAMPITKAEAIYYAHLEMNGKVKLWGRDDDDFWEWNKQQAAAREAANRN